MCHKSRSYLSYHHNACQFAKELTSFFKGVYGVSLRRHNAVMSLSSLFKHIYACRDFMELRVGIDFVLSF